MPTYLFGTEIAPRSKVGTWQLAADRPFALPPRGDAENEVHQTRTEPHCTEPPNYDFPPPGLLLLLLLLLLLRRRSMFLPSTALFFLPSTPPLDRRRLVRFGDPNCDAKMTLGFRVGSAGIDGADGSRPLAAFKALPRNCDAVAAAAAAKAALAPAS